MSAPVIAFAAIGGATLGATLFVPSDARRTIVGSAAQFIAISIYFAAKDTATTPVYASEKRNTTAVVSGMVLSAAISIGGISLIRKEMGANTTLSRSASLLLLTGATAGLGAALLPVW